MQDYSCYFPELNAIRVSQLSGTGSSMAALSFGIMIKFSTLFILPILLIWALRSYTGESWAKRIASVLGLSLIPLVMGVALSAIMGRLQNTWSDWGVLGHTTPGEAA